MTERQRTTLPMHRGGELLTLAPLLSLFGAADLTWTLSWLDVVAARGSGLDVLALEELSRTPSGLTMPGDELVRLASQLDQVIDGEFAGCRTGAEASGQPLVSLTAVDSGEWVVEWDPRTFPDAATAVSAWEKR